MIGTNICMRGSDIGQDGPGRDELWGGYDDWVSRGNTAIVGPDGEVLAGPLRGRQGILYAELDLARLGTQRREFDAVGYYARPDVFRLQVDVTPRASVALAAFDTDLREDRRDTSNAARTCAVSEQIA